MYVWYMLDSSKILMQVKSLTAEAIPGSTKAVHEVDVCLSGAHDFGADIIQREVQKNCR